MIRIELLKTNVGSSAEIAEFLAEIIKKLTLILKTNIIGLRTRPDFGQLV